MNVKGCTAEDLLLRFEVLGMVAWIRIPVCACRLGIWRSGDGIISELGRCVGEYLHYVLLAVASRQAPGTAVYVLDPARTQSPSLLRRQWRSGHRRGCGIRDLGSAKT